MTVTLPTAGVANWDVPLNAALTSLDADIQTRLRTSSAAALYVPLNSDSVINGNVLFRGNGAGGSTADFGGTIDAAGVGGSYYRAPMSLISVNGTNGTRGDSIVSDTANGTGAASFNGFYSNVTGANQFADKGSVNQYAAFGTLAAYSGGGSVYGELGAFVASLTNNRTGGRVEGFESAISSGTSGSPIEGRNAGFVSVLNEYNASITYWSRGFWAASQGSHAAGDALYADGSAGWTNFLRYLDSAAVERFKVDATGTITQTLTAAGTIAEQSYVSGDSVYRFARTTDGNIVWGGGSGATDIALARGAPALLTLTGGLEATVDITARIGGNVVKIGQSGPSGEAGISMIDAVIYRSGASTMQLGSTSGQTVNVGFTGGKVGFQGTGGIVKPTVSGAKGGNAALGSLLTALANYGLVTDSTTA